MPTTITNGLDFISILSRKTAYGLIWTGHYQQKPCVIKMIMLTTGIHYDKDHNIYLDAMGNVITNRYFDHNNQKPFLHTEFKHRRSMTPDAFFSEVNELTHLGSIGMAPFVYGCGINQKHQVHYGFIVMSKVDTSLKDVCMRRRLTSDETQIVTNLVKTLHNVHGLLHGDLQTSNVGVYLNQKDHITQACFFDCQSISHRNQYKSERFNKLAKRETERLFRHIEYDQKNIL